MHLFSGKTGQDRKSNDFHNFERGLERKSMKSLYLVPCFRALLVGVAVGIVCGSRRLQPNVIPVEADTARRSLGSISQPFGSAWCNNKPTFWIVGHQPGQTESPWCLVTDDQENVDNFIDYDYTNSTWKLSATTVMDRQDALNMVDETSTANIDRHDCAAMDVDFDMTVDVICGVGANEGNGYGYNEVYLTQTHDNVLRNVTKGQIVKALTGHGLNRWPAMRNRLVTTLKAADDGGHMILLAVKGKVRADGKTNIHRMFKLVKDDKAKHGFFFKHIPGPWNRGTTAACLHTVDVNLDGCDDILMCQEGQMGRIYLQHANGTFTQVRYASPMSIDWRNARMADVTGDGIIDLIVVGNGARFPASPVSYVRVFQGSSREPFFDFTPSGVWYERVMAYATPDVEVLDANGDGIADIYVVQTDEIESGTYCGRNFEKKTWWGSNNPQPPSSFVPPLDNAQDLLLLGNGVTDGAPKFTEVVMEHAVNGCGSFMEWFGNNYTMILSHGTFSRPGYSVLLQWQP